MPGIDPARPFRPLNIAVLTVSDSRTLDDDRSGNVLVERLTAAGHHLAGRALVRDEPEAIAARFRHWIDDPNVDVVISTGGTSLVDGTSVRIPGRAWFLPDGTNMERNGAVPDLRVPQTPEDEVADTDAQLRAAVEDLLKRVK